MKIPLWTRKLRSTLPFTTASRPVLPWLLDELLDGTFMAVRRLDEMAVSPSFVVRRRPFTSSSGD